MTFSIQVFDPPLCCSTGVCGPDVDPELVRFAADLEWLQEQGVEVTRHNLSQEPGRFAEDPVVARELAARGNQCLPLVLAAGTVASRGRYPARDELVRFAELDAQLAKAQTDAIVAAEPKSSCCGGSKAEAAPEPETKSSCCGGSKAEAAPEPETKSSCCGGSKAEAGSAKGCC